MTATRPYIGLDLKRPFLAGATSADFRGRRFVDMNGAKQVYEGCDFSYAIFERAYFKAAQFKNCRFIGARFIDCNFRSAKFLVCDLAYADFERTLIEAREIVASLPEAPNQRREALQNLRANALAIGDHDALGMLTLQEVKAATEHHRRAQAPLAGMTAQAIASWKVRAGAHFDGEAVSGVADVLIEAARRAKLLVDDSREVFDPALREPSGLDDLIRLLETKVEMAASAE